MTGPKPRPYGAFDDNIGDAEVLLTYAVAFENRRRRRMRQELREGIGSALSIPRRQRGQLDCLQSEDLLVIFVPGGRLSRGSFYDLRPLVRQSLVAACAALETYVADKAMEFVGQALRAEEIPRRMKDISLTVGRWSEIERTYERRGWGVRAVVEDYIRETSSTAPNQIASILSTVGVHDWLKNVDKARRVSGGTTERELSEITERRNRIAHSADRQGRGRASITPQEVREHIGSIRAVVEATESVFANHGL